MRPVLILFAKAPLAGRVKTRLGLAPEAAAELHEAFVADMLDRLQPLGATADLELHTDTPTDAWSGFAVARRLQAWGGDLGWKMFAAIGLALAYRHPRAMIVGSDAPTLPLAHLEALLRAQADVALGPTEDGGYYAISCRRIERGMFDGVTWSGPRALEETTATLKACGLSIELGPTWWDVDSPEDLARLAAEPALPRRTAEWMKMRKWHSK